MSTNQNEKEIAKQLLKLNVRKRKRTLVSKTNFVVSSPYIKTKYNVFYVVNKKNKRRNTSSIRQQEINIKKRIAELKRQLAHLRSAKKLKSCPKCKKAGGICMSRGKKGHLPLISVSEEDMAVIDQKKRRHHTTQNGQTHAFPYMKRKQHDFYVVHKKKRKRHHETQNGQTIGTERKSAFQPFKQFMEQRKRRVEVKVLFKNLNLC